MAQEFDLKLIVNTDELTDTFGKFSIKPLERGYGVTLGNAAGVQGLDAAQYPGNFPAPGPDGRHPPLQ